MKRPLKAAAIPRAASWALLLSAGLSGAALWLSQALAPGSERAAAWVGPCLKLHGFAAAVALVLLGMILAAHLGAAWKHGGRRPSGVPLLAVLLLISLNGWALYYTADEVLRPRMVLAHKVLAVLLPLFYAAHGWRQWLKKP